MEERRQGSALRRQINDLDWTDAGRAMAMWLIYRYSESVINHWDSLAILFVAVFAPKYIGRIVFSRFSGTQQGYTRHTETHDSSVTVTPAVKSAKADNPDKAMQGIVG